MLTIEEIARRLAPVFEASGVTKAVLFGSFAKGTATADSDVDIVVETEAHVRGWDFGGICFDAAECLQKRVDLIPRQDIIPGGQIDLEVAKAGRVIFEKRSVVA